MSEGSQRHREPVAGERTRDTRPPVGDAALLAAFEGARLRTCGSPSLVLFGPGAVGRLPWPGPVWVVTAHNPDGMRVPDDVNAAAHRRLVADLQVHGIAAADVEAGASDWSEDSLLVSGDTFDRERVLDLAERFGQHSVFELTDARIRIVRVRDRRVVSDRPRT